MPRTTRSQAARARAEVPHLTSERAASDADIFAEPPSRTFPKPPDLRRGFDEVVSRIYEDDFDVAEEYAAIEAALTVKDPLSPGALKVAANNAEETARRAYRLYLVARYEYEHYLRATDVLVGAIREAATARLERQKAAGSRTKQITDADVTGEAANSYGDEWAEVCNRREKAKGMLDMINKLQALAEKRVYTLSNLLDPRSGRT